MKLTDFISLADLTTQDLLELLALADELKLEHAGGGGSRPLAGRVVAMLFEKPSLRTRMTFETGIYQMGGKSIFYEDRLGDREPVPDIARNLERWVDAIVARTFAHASVLELAEYAGIPVVNALTDKLHPCQVVADAQTLREHGRDLDGLKVAFVGDGNNVFASWACLAAKISIRLVLVCPEGYGPDADILEYGRANGDVDVTHDIKQGAAGADVIYTDVWASMGQEMEHAARCRAFAPYQVTADMMALASGDVLFMHCLPAHRGEEVAPEVIDGPRSIVFDQAENRLHAQKAIMASLFGG